MVSPNAEIGVVLPARETFGIAKSGALALCARDFAAHSRFRETITILGAGPCEYPDVRYLRLEHWRRWWLRRRAAYARAVVHAARERDFALLEVSNRPHTVRVARDLLPRIKLALRLENDPQTMDLARSAGERQALLARVDAVYCCSHFIAERFLRGVRDPAGKTIVVHNGIDTHLAPTSKERIFAFVGRVIPVKGVVELVEAFALAAPRLPDWRLVIAGDDPGGLLNGPLARAALGDRITPLGQVSHAEAMALFARAEIAVVPSVWEEPFGRSAIEAMSRGCAVIATARGGLAEIVVGAAEIVDPQKTADFAATLRRVATDDDLRRRLQGAALARARDRFDIRRVAAVLDEARARLLHAR